MKLSRRERLEGLRPFQPYNPIPQAVFGVTTLSNESSGCIHNAVRYGVVAGLSFALGHPTIALIL